MDNDKKISFMKLYNRVQNPNLKKHLLYGKLEACNDAPFREWAFQELEKLEKELIN